MHTPWYLTKCKQIVCKYVYTPWYLSKCKKTLYVIVCRHNVRKSALLTCKFDCTTLTHCHHAILFICNSTWDYASCNFLTQSSTRWTNQRQNYREPISCGQSVRKRGSERTEAGESALLAEESPSAGTGRAQTLRILQENIIDFIMGAGGETSLYLPWS